MIEHSIEIERLIESVIRSRMKIDLEFKAILNELKEIKEALGRNVTDLSALSDREREVLGMIASGHSNNEIAKELWLSPNTVKFHCSNIYQKLGVVNRTQAVKHANGNGNGHH